MQSIQEFREFDLYRDRLTTASLIHDTVRGVGFYLSFMVYDFYVCPDGFPTLWAIRIVAALICVIGLPMKDAPILVAYRRFFYATALAILVCSIPIMFFVRNFQFIPADVALVAITLVFCMSTFRLSVFDAIIVGGIYCLCFALLLYKFQADIHTWATFAISLGSAYYMGVVGAIVARNSIYKSFVADKTARQEGERADSILAKVFPAEIAYELKKKNKSSAQRYECVSVMFCDIVDFTKISAGSKPEELLEFLNKIFSAFDRLCSEFGCEKIKTVGDAYMAISGAPTPVSDHATRIVNLAIAINQESRNLLINGKPLQLRIGINSGPVVAGVIGENRFAYDLWGDTVNTASRMEALSPAGAIQVTADTKELLENVFRFEKRPPIEVKGKGLMDTWLVVGPKQGAYNVKGSSGRNRPRLAG